MALLDALHRVTGTAGFGSTLTAKDVVAGRAFVDALLAGRRASDLRGSARADVYAKACAYHHPGVAAARARSKAYRQANAERERARHRDHYAANREAICAQKHDRYWADPEKFRAATRARANEKKAARNVWQAITTVDAFAEAYVKKGGTLTAA